MQADDLVVPVYINQRIVFDLVATMRDGISTVTRTTQSETGKHNLEHAGSGSFGLAAALANFVKVDLQAGKKSEKTTTSEHQSHDERYHTPTSLFARLLSELRSSAYITKYAPDTALRAGQLIELEGSLKVSPLLDACETLVRTFGLIKVFGPKAENLPMKASQHNKSFAPKEETPIEYGIRVIDGIAKSLRASTSIDLVASIIDSKLKALLTIEQQFLNDPSMSDLVDGQFKIVGKVSRVIEFEEPPLDLMRHSSFGKLSPAVLDPLFAAFSHMDAHVKLPEIQTLIQGPAIQVIPIAIYA